MSTFNLGLPVDIPWRRVCYPDDMQNWNTCEGDLPPQWRSSVTVYTYEPPDQASNPPIPADPTDPTSKPYIVTYVKISVTIAPHVEDITGPNGATSYLDYQFTGYLPTTYPCYGALLQVTVRPKNAEDMAHKDWPYFLDAEPKIREIYESVSQTGETLAGSSNGLSVGKSSSTAHSSESKFNFTLPLPGIPIDLGGNSSSSQTSQSRSESTDSSSERRETQSHTTELSQMYHLFQAYHIGTNRTMFLMEPRPHIQSVPATFINGPKELEGVQDIFLVVAKKYDAASDTALCFNVKLDTAHLWTTDQHGLPAYPHPAQVGTGNQTNNQNVNDDEPKFAGMFVTTRNLCCCDDEDTAPTTAVTVTYTETINPPPSTPPTTVQTPVVPPTTPPTLPPTQVDVPILPPVGPPLIPIPKPGTIGIPTGGPGFMTPESIVTSRVLAKKIKEGILKSANSSNTDTAAAVPFTQSDVYYNQILDIARATNPLLQKTIDVSGLLTPTQRDTLQAYMGAKTPLESLVGLDSHVIAGMTGMTIDAVRSLKDQILRGSKPLPVAPPAANPLRNVLSVQILTSGQNPAYPALIYDMADARVMPNIDVYGRPNIIDVEFSGKPDAGTVTTSSFQLLQNGTPVSGTVQQLTLTKYRLLLTSPITLPGTYTLVLHGVGGTPITFGGVGLDGTVTGPLPSGDGIAAADFISAINVVGPLTAPPIPPPMPTLLKITGAHIKTDVGTPATLYDMVTPGAIPTVAASSAPNIIEVNFNSAPDAGTVTTTTFTVSGPSGPITGSIITVSSTTYQFKASVPFAVGSPYMVTLKGVGSPAITLSGSPLDGDPIALPSGNGTAGGNFFFQYQVL